MGKMKDIAIKKLDAADALWAKAMQHNERYNQLRAQQENTLTANLNEHELEYHNYKAFALECEWVDATGHYEHVIGEHDFENGRGFDDSFLDLPKQHECEL